MNQVDQNLYHMLSKQTGKFSVHFYFDKLPSFTKSLAVGMW